MQERDALRARFSRQRIIRRGKCRCASYPHGHQHIAVLVLGFGILWAHLAGGLRVLEFEPHLACVIERLQEVENVAGVEAHDDGLA